MMGRNPSRSFDNAGALPAGVKVVYEDDDIIVVEKPTGLTTAAGPEEPRETLFDMVKKLARAKVGRPTSRSRGRDKAAVEADAGGSSGHGKVFAGIIHRLDREASGLLVFSKNEKAYHWLKDDFKSKRVHRIYFALVEGIMGEVGEQGTIQSFLRESRDGTVASIKGDDFRGGGGVAMGGWGEEHDQARPAVTHYRVLGSGNGMSLVQLRLETGRKHQIRVHMKEKGHPIVGDRRYNAFRDDLRRLCLHAAELGFSHPGTGATVRFRSDPPVGFYTLVGSKVPAPSGTATLKQPPVAHSSHQPEDTSWENVAGWYDALIDEKRSDHYDKIIIPGTLRMVKPQPGVRVLDVACGQGVISRELARLGASVVGVDSSPALVDTARARAVTQGLEAEFHIGDARSLDALPLADASFDSVTCVMAMANINPLEPLLASVARVLKPGGTLVFSITHPAFRAPDQTSWGWDEKTRGQYRRVDGYLSLGQKAIKMHPGSAPDIVTWTFHRPLQTYVRLLSEAGLLVETLEEWPAVRVSEPGPRAEAENRARREIPLFVGIRAIKR
jgi:23S rRNA-/tRNA-specific pseudouridylate synthase/ubiquinone/menaquinone biosynthesis C-methylase UbiE